MPAYFEEGFFVRTPAWHGMGVVLDDYPGREQAMILAGHDFVVIEKPVAVITPHDDDWQGVDYQEAQGWKALLNEKTGVPLNLVRESYEVIQNDTAWDVVDLIVGEGARYETGITLKDGALCVVTAWLDEPVTITGDNSPLLPYLAVRWTHDGSGALSCRSTSVRVVCANTDALSQAESKKLGTEFTFRHTKRVHERIEDAKMAIKGMRLHHEAYVQLAEELAAIKVTKAQREFFITEFIPTPPAALISDRVKKNIDKARDEVRAIFSSATVPEAHEYTAWGLRLAGVEWLDHMRGWRNSDTLVGRQILRTEPAKEKLNDLIREAVKA